MQDWYEDRDFLQHLIVQFPPSSRAVRPDFLENTSEVCCISHPESKHALLWDNKWLINKLLSHSDYLQPRQDRDQDSVCCHLTVNSPLAPIMSGTESWGRLSPEGSRSAFPQPGVNEAVMAGSPNRERNCLFCECLAAGTYFLPVWN